MLIGLISCSKAKLPHPAPARDLYSPSALFRGALRTLAGRAQTTYVLSAKHGLIPLDQEVAPYDQTLKDASPAERQTWAQAVLRSLQVRHGQSLAGITFEIHAGAAYRTPLEGLLKLAGATCTCPVDGLTMGQRLAFYTGNQPPARVLAAPAAVVPGTVAALADLAALLYGLEGQSLATATGAPFHVESVTAERVTVVPLSTGKPRPIPWREIQGAYNHLMQHRSITLAEVREVASEANPAYVFAMLARLPGTSPDGGRPVRLRLK